MIPLAVHNVDREADLVTLLLHFQYSHFELRLCFPSTADGSEATAPPSGSTTVTTSLWPSWRRPAEITTVLRFLAVTVDSRLMSRGANHSPFAALDYPPPPLKGHLPAALLHCRSLHCGGYTSLIYCHHRWRAACAPIHLLCVKTASADGGMLRRR